MNDEPNDLDRFQAENAEDVKQTAKDLGVSEADYLIEWLGDTELSDEALIFLGVKIVPEGKWI